MSAKVIRSGTGAEDIYCCPGGHLVYVSVRPEVERENDEHTSVNISYNWTAFGILHS